MVHHYKTGLYLLTVKQEVEATAEKGEVKICGSLNIDESVEPGELKEYSLSLRRTAELYNRIELDTAKLKIYICDEIGKATSGPSYLIEVTHTHPLKGSKYVELVLLLILIGHVVTIRTCYLVVLPEMDTCLSLLVARARSRT